MTAPTADDRPPLHRPLSGLTVIDLGSSLPTALCVSRLAAWGAAVTKVERPDGDPGRRRPPVDADGISLRFKALNGAARSVAINLKQAVGRDVLAELVRDADIVTTSLPPEVCKHLGADFHRLASFAPRVIYCRFANDSQGDRPGHDINYLAEAGVLDAYRDSSGATLVPPLPVSDLVASVVGAGAIVAALHGRSAHGLGTEIEVPIGDCALWLSAAVFPEPLAYGSDFRRHLRSSREDAYYRTYECADGREVAVGAVEDSLRERLRAALDLHAPEGQPGAQASELADRFRSRTCAEWESELAHAGCAVSPVRALPEALAEDRSAVSPKLVRVRTGSSPDEILTLAMPEVLAGEHPSWLETCPAIGEHTRAWLLETGRSDAEIEELFRRGIVA